VVEDDFTTRLAMRESLVKEGFSVLSAATGGEAARCLDNPPRPIDVAVFDVGLPDVNGAELCEVVKEFHPYLPVVICSGMATPEDVDRVRRSGVRQFLTKPVDPEELVSAVESALP
jgi:DNA-binding response OmpR family regulator